MAQGLADARFLAPPTTLAAGEATNVDMSALTRLSFYYDSGATVTVSRVNSLSASSHGIELAGSTYSGADGVVVTIDIDWPYYRISTATAGCTFARV